jgi:hypothetical protein
VRHVWRGWSPDSSEAGANDPAHVVNKRVGGVEKVNAAVARSVEYGIKVAEIVGRVTPRSDRVTLAIKAS